MMKNLLKGPWLVFFIAATFILISSCATAPPAKEEAKATPVKAETKAPPPKKEAAPLKEEGPTSEILIWASEADGVAQDGEITRTSAPAFSLEYPEDFEVDERGAADIIRVKGPGGLPILNIVIGKLTGDKKEFLAGFAEEYVQALEKLGTDIEIIYSKPLPADIYGEQYPAQEFEIEWMAGGSTLITSYANLIFKEDYYIALQGHVMGDIDELKAIYETIDLEP
jgi:hypothetical protein